MTKAERVRRFGRFIRAHDSLRRLVASGDLSDTQIAELRHVLAKGFSAEGLSVARAKELFSTPPPATAGMSPEERRRNGFA